MSESFDPAQVERALLAVLGPDGALARKLPGYESRPSQLQMARAVAAALMGKSYALVEAGTGTGKTLAYLVPAILSGKKVIVSTATKTLQDQLVHKDLPLLRSIGLPFKASVMKGRGNYLCKLRFERFSEEPTFQSRAEAKFYPRIQSWASRTDTGDRSELSLPDTFGAWRELSANAETCLGSRCPHYEDCFVTKMRQDAQASDLVVVNHHLFFADLSVRARTQDRQAEVLPRYDAAIFDEAHHLEGVASDHFGAQLSSLRVDELARDATAALLPTHDLYEHLAPVLPQLKLGATELFAAIVEASGGAIADAQRLGEEVRLAAARSAGTLIDALSELNVAFAEVTEPELQALGRRADEMLADLGFLLGAPDQKYVYAVEMRARTVIVRAHPIDVARALAERVWSGLDTAVFASATLANGGAGGTGPGAFAYAVERLGLVDEDGGPRRGLETLQLPSPFDYARQSILYVPTHLPEASSPEFAAQASEEIVRLCELTGGRAFILCTSHRSMHELHGLLKGRVPYPLLLQGELPKEQLIKAFLEEPSVLVGAYSFWEGVDVQGDALSLVVIDKLPFANPRDPVVDARVALLKERGVDAFAEFQVPQAALALRQGFGRLIRSKRDLGIVAVLDRRLRTKGYGKGIIDSLPSATRVGAWDNLGKTWELLKQGAAKRAGPGGRPAKAEQAGSGELEVEYDE